MHDVRRVLERRPPRPLGAAVAVEHTNQRLPDRWRVKTMKRFGSSVTLHRAGAARRARTALDGPAARALVASATTLMNNCLNQNVIGAN